VPAEAEVNPVSEVLRQRFDLTSSSPHPRPSVHVVALRVSIHERRTARRHTPNPAITPPA